MSILHNYVEMAAMVLFGVGFTTLLLHRNMIKKIIGFSIMDCAIFLFLAAKGYIEGRRAPIVENGVQDMEAYINPIPAGLVLTGIVVSVSVTAVMLALTVRLYRRYHTLDIDEITRQCLQEDEPDIISIGNVAVPVELAQMPAFAQRSLQQGETLLKAEKEDGPVELAQMPAFAQRSLQQGETLLKAVKEDEPDIISIGNVAVPVELAQMPEPETAASTPTGKEDDR